MRTKLNLILAILMLFVFTTALPVLADDATPKPEDEASQLPPHRPIVPQRGPLCTAMAFMPPPAEWMTFAGKQLDLTEDQVKKAKEMITALNNKIRTLQSQNQAGNALIEEMRANPTDPAKVQKLAAEALKVEESILQTELQTWMEFEKMLTPDQQTKFWNLLIRRPSAGGVGGPPPPVSKPGGPEIPPPHPNG